MTAFGLNNVRSRAFLVSARTRIHLIFKRHSRIVVLLDVTGPYGISRHTQMELFGGDLQP